MSLEKGKVPYKFQQFINWLPKIQPEIEIYNQKEKVTSTRVVKSH